MIIALFIILISSIVLSSESSMNFLTKGFADTLYCKINGDCSLSTLNVTNLRVINTTLTNQNVTGNVNAYSFSVNGTDLSYTYQVLLINSSNITCSGNQCWYNGTAGGFTNGSDITVRNITAEWFNGNFNWYTGDYYLSFNGSRLLFNSTTLQSTIISTLSANTYIFVNNQTVYGTVPDGNISLLQILDSTSFNITEAGTDGILYYANTTANVTNPSSICIRYKYNGNNMSLSLGNTVSSWEKITDLLPSSTYTLSCQTINNPTQEIIDSKVLLKLNGTKAGSTKPLINISTSKLISYWTFDGIDTVGTTTATAIDVFDSNNGTVTDAQINATGIINQAYNFSKPAPVAYLDAGTGPGNNMSANADGFSISIWFKKKSAATDKGIVSMGSLDSSQPQFFLRTDATTGGLTTLHTRLNASHPIQVAITNQTKDWVYYVFTYNGSNAAVYINGTLMNVTDYPGTVNLAGENFIVGAYYSILYGINATIDEVSLWNRSLSYSEVDTLWNGGMGESYVSPYEDNSNRTISIDYVYATSDVLINETDPLSWHRDDATETGDYTTSGALNTGSITSTGNIAGQNILANQNFSADIINDNTTSSVVSINPNTRKLYASNGASMFVWNTDGTLQVGSGAIGTDYRIDWIGESSTGTMKWMEDEKIFNFTDRLYVTNNISTDGYVFGNLSFATGVCLANGSNCVQFISNNTDANLNKLLINTNGITIYNDSNSYFLANNTGLIFRNDETNIANSIGKNQFLATYAPASGAASSTTGNYFRGIINNSIIATAGGKYRGNVFVSDIQGPVTGSGFPAITYSGTEFQNLVTGNYVSGGPTIGSFNIGGTYFNNTITGKFLVAGGFGITPVVVDVNANFSASGASHYITGFTVNTKYSAGNIPNWVHGIDSIVLLEGRMKSSGLTSPFYGEIQPSSTNETIQNNAAIYTAGFQSSRESNFNITSGKILSGFWASDMANGGFNISKTNPLIGFYTDLISGDNVYAFKSEYAQSSFKNTTINGTLNIISNITMYSPNGTSFNCGVNDTGYFSCN